MTNVNAQSQIDATSAAGVPAADDATPLVGFLLRAAAQLRLFLNAQLSSLEINDVRLAVMEIIEAARAAGGCSQVELAARIEQSESSVSALIERMRHSGLVYRLDAPSDRRRHVLKLSDEGRSKLHAARALYRQQADAALACLSANEQAALDRMLGQLLAQTAQQHSAANVMPESSQPEQLPQPAEAGGLLSHADRRPAA